MSELFMNYHPDPYVREYTDRGMAKWLGFYLSEHTAEMEKETCYRTRTTIRREQMSLSEIAEKLSYAYQERKVIELQLNTLLLDETPIDNTIGTVVGIEDNEVFILTNKEQRLQVISFEAIKFVSYITDLKWSELL